MLRSSGRVVVQVWSVELTMRNNSRKTISEELWKRNCCNWDMWMSKKRLGHIARWKVLDLSDFRIRLLQGQDATYESLGGMVLSTGMKKVLFLCRRTAVTNFDDDVDDPTEKDLALNVDHIFEADQCDAFDSDVDEAPNIQTMFMVNLSSEDPIYDEAGPSYDSNTPFEVQDHDTCVDHLDEYHEVHEMQNDVQHNYVVDSDAEYASDSNIIRHNQYMEDNKEHGVQSMSANKQVKVVNDTLTFELARYKELVGVYEKRTKFELTEREQKIDEQMRIIISDQNRKETSLKSELHSAQLQLRSTLNHHKIVREEAIILKKDFKQKEDKFLEEFLDIKRLKEKLGLPPPQLLEGEPSAPSLHKLKSTPEQIFWSIDNNDRKKAETSVPKPLSALTVYPPNTPVKLVPRVLPTKSQVKITTRKSYQEQRTNVIRDLKVLVSNVNDRSCEPYNANDVTALIEQNECVRVELEEIEDLKAQLEGNLKVAARSSVKTKVLAPGMYAIDVEPIPPRLKNNRNAHLTYINHLKESVETVREIVEEARVVKPLDNVLNYACQYTKLSQELVEYVIGTCPKEFTERDSKAPSIPLTRKKQVTFTDTCRTSSSNTQKHEVHQKVQQTNVPVIHSTGVNTSTRASGSKPRSNTKQNRILPAKSVNNKKVEDNPRTNKSVWTKVNRVDSSISSKRVVINSNSESVCKTCNKCLNSASHEMCVVNILNSVNATPTVKIVLNKGKQIWKPKGKLSDNSLNKTKQVWKATGKLFANVGYQWRPTGKKFALGELCPLTRIPVTCGTDHPLVSGLRLFKTYDGESFKAQELCGKVHRNLQQKCLNTSKFKPGLHCKRRLKQISSNLVSQMSQRRLLASLQGALFLKEEERFHCKLQSRFDIFVRAFTTSANVPSIYIQLFWNTLTHDAKTRVYSFQVDEHWLTLSADLLRKALNVTPADSAHPFESPPAGKMDITFTRRRVPSNACEDEVQPALEPSYCHRDIWLEDKDLDETLEISVASLVETGSEAIGYGLIKRR
ncbi:hypothetical protein Tco_0331793 [Tanacetum coccineum]